VETKRAKRTLLAEVDVLNLLRTEIMKAGSQSAWARRAGVNRPTINSILHGRRTIQPKVLSALGLRKVFAYYPIKADV
jgi:plasmid maintenance system antidote protein VapI